MKIDLYRNENKTVIDACDRIVVNAFLRKERDNCKTFLICGCDARVGTTSISVEMAISMAVSGWKTILIDADLRKEGRYKRLNQKTEAGFSDYQAGDELDEKYIYETNWKGLDYMSCGKNDDETPVKIFCSVHTEELLHKLRERYEVIIFDASSLYAAIDAKILSAKVDCTYMVAASGQTTFEALSMAHEQLEEAGAAIGGIILNKLPLDEYKRYLKNYDYFQKKDYINTFKAHLLEDEHQNTDAAEHGGEEEKKQPEQKGKPKKAKGRFFDFWRGLMGCVAVLLVSACLSLAFAGKASAAPDTDMDTDILREQTEAASGTAGTFFDESAELPILMVIGYQITEGTAEKGTAFTVEFTVQNMRRSIAAYHVITTVFANTEGLHLSNGETNQRYFETLEGNGTARFAMEFESDEEFAGNAANFEVRFDYVNRYGAVGTNTTSITPQIGDSSKLQILSVTAAETAKLGSRALLNIRYSNTGEADIKKIVMRLDGNIENSGEDIELQAPNKSQRQIYLDESIVFTKTGQQKVIVNISYEDENGASFSMDPIEVSTFVMGNSEANAVTVTKEKNGSVTEWVQQYPAVFFLAVVGCGAAAFAWRRKKRRGER